MADNVTLNPGSGGSVISTDEILGSGGVEVQRVKVQYGLDGYATDVSTTNPLPVLELNGTTTTRSSTTGTTDAEILASNTSRIGATFYNDADQDFLLGEGTATATTSDFTIRMKPGSFYSIDDYTGSIRGLFTATVGSGALYITEITK